MDTVGDRHHRCLFGWVHVLITIRIVLGYFIFFNIGLGFLRLPTCSIYVALLGILICIFTTYHVFKKNGEMLFPFYIYVFSTILYLLFLGGYFFYVNIFDKKRVIDALGDHSDKLSFIWHLADILLMLLHSWALSVVSKCRKYFQFLAEPPEQAVELQVVNTAPRQQSIPDAV